ncbi:MAG: FAD-binding oxidoreductase [Nocardioidaceae bacterium]
MTDSVAPDPPASPMAWDAWGDPVRTTPLSDHLRELLAQAFGVDPTPEPPVREEDVRLRASTLRAADRDALAAIVGAGAVSTADAVRLRHAGGKSTLDLLRRRLPEQEAPDAVVEPASHDDVLAVLRLCAERRIAVVSFGGGTSVVGGVDPVRDGFRAVIALDLRRLSAVTDVDARSGTATLGAGLTGPRAEALLAEHGVCIGHFPQSFEFATIGGFAATRSSGQSSAGYGRFDDMVQGLTVATPRGTLSLGRGPASAAGPDLRAMFLGSEGVLGVITDVTLRVHATPAHTVHGAWSFPDFAAGADAVRTLVQRGGSPTVLRLSDEAETAVNLAVADSIGSSAPTPGCLAIATFDGTPERAQRSAETAREILESTGATWCGAAPAEGWERGRFDAPYLRDALLRVGVLTETLETATTWSNLLPLRAAVSEALTASLAGQGTPPLVLCHLSHTYRTGASLYFTVACKQTDDPIGQWSAAKRDACDAIVRTGGTISHHHAVGRDHRPWMRDEIGDLGVDVLRAVKATLDPAGVLNPGKLIP